MTDQLRNSAVTKGICIKEMKPRIIDIGPEFSPNDCWIHNERDNLKASILVRLFDNMQHVRLPTTFWCVLRERSRHA